MSANVSIFTNKSKGMLMSHISSFILISCLLFSSSATANPPVAPPSNTGPNSNNIPKTSLIDGSSPVLLEQAEQKKKEEEEKKRKEEEEKKKRKEEEEKKKKEEAENEVKLGTNIGAEPANYPSLEGAQTVEFNFPQGIELMQLIRLMAQATGRNFILGDDIKGSVTVISHKPLTVPEAYEAFLSILEVSGYTTVAVGKNTKVVPTAGASQSPLRVNKDGDIPDTDNFVTQIIQLENVSVSEISKIVKDLSGKSAKIIAYAPTNTLIITDSGVNIRRVYNIISQMDVAAPKSKLRIIPLTHATASDIEKIINDLYGDESKTKNNKSTSSNRKSKRKPRTKDSTSANSSATNVGSEGKYIEKIISDERTNSLLVLANEEALEAVTQLIADLDVDVDPSSRAQIHVVYLEHAKAEDVSQVLSNLSDNRGGSNKNNRTNRANNRTNSKNNTNKKAQSPGDKGTKTASSAVAAFDSGIRITHDENTNSLVIIATPDQIQYVKQVIEKLDIRRKQVFVEAVVLELASDETSNMGLGAHMGMPNDDGSMSIFSSQLNGSSFGLSADLLTGMAMGVFGEPISVAISDGLGGVTDVSVPAFGIALNALQSNSSVNILSTPNILTLDNEEATIVVGRNIPFPVSTGRDNNNNPIVSYQREDVAITLKVTPQINESNYVTLTVFQEVQEVEEDSQGLDVSTAGFITSVRSADTTVLVKDNQTVVIGGLIGATDTQVETKIPILGDIPVIGKLFRGKRTSSRKSNMLIFLTPHVIDDEGDLEEVYRVKVAQRQEFIRRFYGKSREAQEEELLKLLQYSMNQIDQPSMYRGNQYTKNNWEVIGAEAPAADPVPDTSNTDSVDETNQNSEDSDFQDDIDQQLPVDENTNTIDENTNNIEDVIEEPPLEPIDETTDPEEGQLKPTPEEMEDGD
jgi:general secretion pathway protein D